MNQKMILNNIRLYSIHMNRMSKIGRKYASNVTNISNKSQITGAYSKGQGIKYPISSKNLILRHCSPFPSITLNDAMMESMPMTTTRRPLTLIFAWMLAQDKHLEKYRQMWFRRGFDVLTVQTSPIDLLMPPIGGRIVAKNLVKYLSEIHSQYNEVVVHAFSVGGYQFAETLVQLKAHEEYNHIWHSFKGVILDSCVFPDDCPSGLSRAVTLNPVVQPLIETSVKMFLKVFYNISMKYYREAEVLFDYPDVKYPGLLLYSSDDVVCSVESNEKLAKKWTECGNRVRSKCWTKSTHVLHYRDHQSEYEQEVDTFINSLNLKSSSF